MAAGEGITPFFENGLLLKVGAKSNDVVVNQRQEQ